MPYEFSPTHKMLLTTNRIPNVADTDEGIWRRLHLILCAAALRLKPGFPDPGGYAGNAIQNRL
jgi:hypothetical protein